MQAGKFIAASEISPTYLDGMYACYGGNGIRGYVANYSLDGDYPVIGRQGALCGNVNMAHGKFYATEHAVVVTPMENIDLNWLYYTLIALNLNQYASGAAQPGLAVNNILKVHLMLPPTNEQKRIANTIENTISIIKTLDVSKDELTNTIQATKNKILDLAIRGKLVPQNPDDEPASMLLERIRAEKEELIKQGKIKRDKKESIIFKGDDNSYYENLPKGWVITKLGLMSSVITKGTTPRGGNVAYLDNGIGFLRAENIEGYDRLNLQNLKFIDENTHNGFLKRSILQNDDILITIAGTLGRTAIVTDDVLPLNTNQAVAIIRLVNPHLVYNRFIAYAINSNTIKKALLQQEVAMAIPNLSLENIHDCVLPLPPLNEQLAIVEVIDELFVVIDDIEKSLN